MLTCRPVARRQAEKKRRPGRPPKHGAADEARQRFPGARVITRYGNRRLYDPTASRAITLDELAELVRKGEDVRVVDGDTGEDLTRRVLTQIILEEPNRRVLEILPVELLQRLIALRSDTLATWIGQYLEAGARFMSQQWSQAGVGGKAMQDSFEAMFPWMQKQAAPRPDADTRLRDELEELKRRMADLTSRIKR
jgi:polyhydroxyalkanoate synthesis repressor PhaR